VNRQAVDYVFLGDKARRYRKEILETIAQAGSGHPGGSLSCVEILISLYFYKLNHRPNNPEWELRDRFILSKGHASPALYVTLADCGYFSGEELKKFRKLGALLQGHAYSGVPGVEFSTGSLGHGLSVANGMALAGKISRSPYRVYCLLGDGELQEGSVWEAAMTASQHKLGRVCAIIDRNGVQQNDRVSSIKNEEPLADKWKDFGWSVLEADGHSFGELIEALDNFSGENDKPSLIIAGTVKGKGVSFMEGQAKWHGRAPDKEELRLALKELGF
jgi:transketolase